MPWNDCKPMDERLKFIARLLEGEKLAPLCREFGISRVTGYKIFNCYKECGLDGLYNRSRAPYRQANKLPFQVERTILGIKKGHPSWGAPKNRAKLIRQYPMIPAAGRDRPLSSGYSNSHYEGVMRHWMTAARGLPQRLMSNSVRSSIQWPEGTRRTVEMARFKQGQVKTSHVQLPAGAASARFADMD